MGKVDNLSVVVKEYSSVAELLKSIDDAISDLRKTLGEYLRRIEELRVKVEQENKLKAVLGKLGLTTAPPPNELSLRNVRVVVNPTAEQELGSLEVALEGLNARLTQLTSIRKDLDVLSPLGDTSVKITVIYVDGVPKSVFIRIV
jgi:chromosome segregation ATPase